MKLACLRVRNFRCYRNEITIEFNELTAIVGKNDVGKSTLMDALDIFLNDGNPDKSDASKAGDGKDLTIICEFSSLPTQVIIDEDAQTSLVDEYMLNANGRLEIHKTYSGHTASPKCTSVALYAVHPGNHKTADLLRLKNAELKKRAKELNVDLADVDQKVNAQIRRAIRQSVADLDLSAQFIPLNEDNGKKIWEGLRTHIPILALFKSDRTSTDQDAEAQDPLKAAVKEALKQKEADLNALALHVEAQVREIAAKTLEKIKEMDPSLAQQLNPQISVKKWDSLFAVNITGDEDIPINKRGSGVKRLILLNFFRAKAEQLAKEKNDATVIYAIEEPETSQHPHNQRLLLAALSDLSADNQIVITTHTPMLARALSDDCLRYVHDIDGKGREIRSGGGEVNKLLTHSLGVLPDNAIKLFVGVEGKHDIAFLKALSGALRSGGIDVWDLEKMELNGELLFFPLGGSSLALWTSRLEPLCRPEFHLFDRDIAPPANAKYQVEADVINKRQRCKAVITGKREVENYLHYEAINEAYSERCNIALGLMHNFADFDDVPAKVAERVHALSGPLIPWGALDYDSRNSKISKAKRHLNQGAAAHMTKERLAHVDVNGDVLAWFSQMKSLAQQ